MSIDISNQWKTPVWKVSKFAGQLKMVLRVREAWVIINNVDTEKQGRYKIMELSNGDARKQFFALLLSGMRLSELIRLKQKLYDNDGDSLFRDNGSILLVMKGLALQVSRRLLKRNVLFLYLILEGKK